MKKIVEKKLASPSKVVESLIGNYLCYGLIIGGIYLIIYYTVFQKNITSMFTLLLCTLACSFVFSLILWMLVNKVTFAKWEYTKKDAHSICLILAVIFVLYLVGSGFYNYNKTISSYEKNMDEAIQRYGRLYSISYASILSDKSSDDYMKELEEEKKKGLEALTLYYIATIAGSCFVDGIILLIECALIEKNAIVDDEPIMETSL